MCNMAPVFRGSWIYCLETLFLMSDLNGLRHLYAQTASVYESQVIPAFAPLAKDFAAWALRSAADHLQYRLFDPFDSDNQNDSVRSDSDLLTKLNVIDLC